MNLPLIAVSGKNGQLGSELQQLAKSYSQYQFLFADKAQLDLSKKHSIEDFFKQHKPDYFINCAAYTAVDKAEQQQPEAYTINAEAVGIIAQECNTYNTTLIQLSTDYVFNGNANTPYQPDDATNPINYYGYTKWLGEKLALENCDKCIVIRTSWVYSEFGNNFVKTMLRLMKERETLNVVSDQFGCPTYAADLASAIMNVIEKVQHDKATIAGIFHYSNAGVITWFDFAVAIKKLAGFGCEVMPIATSAYPTPAKRPHYSVMNTDKIKKVFGVNTPFWGDSLGICVSKLM